jgi:putative oxidoreductase
MLLQPPLLHAKAVTPESARHPNSVLFSRTNPLSSTDSSKLFNAHPRLRDAWWAIPLRAVVGYGFMAHGFAKVSRGAPAFEAALHALGVPHPHLMAWATIAVELLGGLAVLIGAFIALVSVPLTVVLLVAMFTVHLPYGFSSIKLVTVTKTGAQFGPPGYETDLLYIACLAALVIGGTGPFAVDHLIARRRRTAP